MPPLKSNRCLRKRGTYSHLDENAQVSATKDTEQQQLATDNDTAASDDAGMEYYDFMNTNHTYDDEYSSDETDDYSNDDYSSGNDSWGSNDDSRFFGSGDDDEFFSDGDDVGDCF